MRADVFQQTITKVIDVNLSYLLKLPPGYEDETGEVPLVLFLHGAGERGTDPELVKTIGLPEVVEKGDFPFIFLAPQCPISTARRSNWIMELDGVAALLTEVIKTHRVDMKRIYLTGMSMGAYGAFKLASRMPDLFAALAPICGGGCPEKAERLKDIPTWIFHGERDDVIPIRESLDMVNAIKAAGGNVKFTSYPEAGHDSWTAAYNDPEFYEWLLKQTK
ncbi:prolyl oligopeptidase family serine peptidase [Peribacillus frigoritolerans]|uniref:carboxylesterase family protein n=1 Tax=Peribacillus frigoritolerans TaxID=450367 RepID=UPI00105A30A6|nr:PHB depolymerase family esterase [Peribacillus frigoritolerans]TDL83034.1 phospholipase [Peribacillus frigoritolerans]